MCKIITYVSELIVNIIIIFVLLHHYIFNHLLRFRNTKNAKNSFAIRNADSVLSVFTDSIDVRFRFHMKLSLSLNSWIVMVWITVLFVMRLLASALLRFVASRFGFGLRLRAPFGTFSEFSVVKLGVRVHKFTYVYIMHSTQKAACTRTVLGSRTALCTRTFLGSDFQSHIYRTTFTHISSLVSIISSMLHVVVAIPVMYA